MEAVTIETLHSRYRLPASAAAQKARLDRVLGEVMNDYLELALARAGVPSDGEVCIRCVQSRARVRLSDPDSTLGARLGLAVAEAVREAATKHGFDVVAYRSRHHALLDLVAAAAAGELSRAWAWRQIGLWHAAGNIDRAQAVGEAMQALRSQPRAAASVLAALASSRSQDSALAALAGRAGIDQWLPLARAVLGAATSSATAQAVLESIDEPAAPNIVSRRCHMIAARIAERSAIARASLSLARGTVTAPPVATALAVLAIAEVEPAALCEGSGPLRALIMAVAGAFRAPSIAQTVVSSHQAHHAATAPGTRTVEARGAISADGSAGMADAARRRELATVRASADDRRAGIQETPSVPGPSPIPDTLALATTAAGGLLFFVKLVDRLGLAAKLEERLPERALRVVLHQLAMMIAELEPDDPAALAFAGLGPDAVPPSRSDEPLSEAESRVIENTARDPLIAAVRQRLARTPNADDLLALGDRELTTFLCSRPAEIAADPGWIDVRFSLDDVSTDIRRAGLDLDPGWVPWLGVVMRFIYV
jgi:hypothetical protein